MSNSFTPKTTSYAAHNHWVADEKHTVVAPGGYTIDPDTVEEDEGKKYLASGTPMGKITASGKVGPYDVDAEDGREVMFGLLYNTGGVDMTGSDAEMCSIFLGGVVHEARLPSAITSQMKADNPRIQYL